MLQVQIQPLLRPSPETAGPVPAVKLFQAWPHVLPLEDHPPPSTFEIDRRCPDSLENQRPSPASRAAATLTAQRQLRAVENLNSPDSFTGLCTQEGRRTLFQTPWKPLLCAASRTRWGSLYKLGGRIKRIHTKRWMISGSSSVFLFCFYSKSSCLVTQKNMNGTVV